MYTPTERHTPPVPISCLGPVRETTCHMCDGVRKFCLVDNWIQGSSSTPSGKWIGQTKFTLASSPKMCLQSGNSSNSSKMCLQTERADHATVLFICGRSNACCHNPQHLLQLPLRKRTALHSSCPQLLAPVCTMPGPSGASYSASASAADVPAHMGAPSGICPAHLSTESKTNYIHSTTTDPGLSGHSTARLNWAWELNDKLSKFMLETLEEKGQDDPRPDADQGDRPPVRRRP